MAQVSVRINGRTYPVTCDPGEEEHVRKLAAFVDAKVAELAARVGQVGDSRLLVLASLLIADELGDAYDDLAALRRDAVAVPPPPAAAPAAGGGQLALDLDRLAERVERIADSLAGR